MATTQQFLKSVLSQRGPSALPYSEDVKLLIPQHLLALHQSYPSLRPQNRPHALPRRHLQHPRRHLVDRFLSTSSSLRLCQSYSRYDHQKAASVCLSTLAVWFLFLICIIGFTLAPVFLISPGVLSDVFARDPPLYSPASINPAAHGTNPARPVVPPRLYEDPAEVFRQNAINNIVQMAHKDVVVLTRGREAEMEGMFNARGVLRQREQQVVTGVRDMVREKEPLEQKLQMVVMMEAWLNENADKVQKLSGLDADDVFQPCDALSKQMIEVTSLDLAIEDTIYSLDKAAQDGVIPFDQYLRTVRPLSREQLFHRA